MLPSAYKALFTKSNKKNFVIGMIHSSIETLKINFFLHKLYQLFLFLNFLASVIRAFTMGVSLLNKDHSLLKTPIGGRKIGTY